MASNVSIEAESSNNVNMEEQIESRNCFSDFELDLARSIEQSEQANENEARIEKDSAALFDQIYYGGYNGKISLQPYEDENILGTMKEFSIGAPERKRRHFMYCMDHTKIIDMENHLRHLERLNVLDPYDPMTEAVKGLLGWAEARTLTEERITRKKYCIADYRDWYFQTFFKMRYRIPNAAQLLANERDRALARCNDILSMHLDRGGGYRNHGVRLPF